MTAKLIRGRWVEDGERNDSLVEQMREGRGKMSERLSDHDLSEVLLDNRGRPGDVWLVPAYTGRERKEITPEHAATLARVMSVFPGSHIVSFEKTAKTNNPERRERPLEERS